MFRANKKHVHKHILLHVPTSFVTLTICVPIYQNIHVLLRGSKHYSQILEFHIRSPSSAVWPLRPFAYFPLFPFLYFFQLFFLFPFNHSFLTFFGNSAADAFSTAFALVRAMTRETQSKSQFLLSSSNTGQQQRA